MPGTGHRRRTNRPDKEMPVPTWMLYAFASMAFAGVTAVVAKFGLQGLSADVGLAVRTAFVFAFVVPFVLAVVPRAEWGRLQGSHVGWLALSALATAASWVCYYRAIALGEVSGVALIDKGSVVVAVLLAALLLGESLSAAKLAGCGLIVAGLLVIARG